MLYQPPFSLLFWGARQVYESAMAQDSEQRASPQLGLGLLEIETAASFYVSEAAP